MNQLLGYLVFGLLIRFIYCSAIVQDCTESDEDQIPQQGEKSPPSAPSPISETEDQDVPIIGAHPLGYLKTPWIGDAVSGDTAKDMSYFDDFNPFHQVTGMKSLDIYWNDNNELSGFIVEYETIDSGVIKRWDSVTDSYNHELIQLSKYEEIIGVKGNLKAAESAWVGPFHVIGEISFVVLDKVSQETRTYGPYGHGDSYPFDYNLRIIGLHGNAWVYALGFYYIETPIKGPRFGGTGGAQWEDPILSHSPAIVNIDYLTIWHGNFIDGIQVTYTTVGGGSVQGDKHGGSGGTKNLIDLEPGEYIVYIESMSSDSLLGSITFTTRKMDGKTVTYGPYGEFTSSCTVSKSIPGKIIGFYGGEGDFLDSLGVYYTEEF